MTTTYTAPTAPRDATFDTAVRLHRTFGLSSSSADRTVTIEGEGPSVLRRAIAAAKAAGVAYVPEDGLVQAAIVAAREHATLRAESALLSSIATVRLPDRYAADNEVEVIAHADRW